MTRLVLSIVVAALVLASSARAHAQDPRAWWSSPAPPTESVNPEWQTVPDLRLVGIGVALSVLGYGASVALGIDLATREECARTNVGSWFVPVGGGIAGALSPTCPSTGSWFATPRYFGHSFGGFVASIAQVAGIVLLTLSPFVHEELRVVGPHRVPMRLALDVGAGSVALGLTF
ncbi:hypothetical protein [Sandaracinus amylolyticus]|uniref:hypothetical protein n=1 Tax=Sandaracinus amylolyticus TaxID=927083 RepID=UPI001F46CA4B|nr:hypothetical protein [Sandaracinus amylolyticus]UJR86403.1 Hypothetical protein I5071_84980 [Sandaracinus amylolyticus]